MSAPEPKKDDWKEKAALKKAEKEAMRAKDKEKAPAQPKKEDRKKAETRPVPAVDPALLLKTSPQPVQGQKQKAIEQKPAGPKNPIFQVREHVKRFEEQPLIYPRMLNSLSIIGESEHGKDFGAFYQRVMGAYPLITKFLAQLLGPEDLVVVGSRHHVFKHVRFPCPSVWVGQPLHEGDAVVGATYSGAMQLVESAKAIVIGASVLSADGAVYSSRGTLLLCSYGRSLGKKVFVVGETYKLGRAQERGREGLDKIEGGLLDAIVTEAQLCRGSGLHSLFCEYR